MGVNPNPNPWTRRRASASLRSRSAVAGGRTPGHHTRRRACWCCRQPRPHFDHRHSPRLPWSPVRLSPIRCRVVPARPRRADARPRLPSRAGACAPRPVPPPGRLVPDSVAPAAGHGACLGRHPSGAIRVRAWASCSGRAGHPPTGPSIDGARTFRRTGYRPSQPARRRASASSCWLISKPERTTPIRRARRRAAAIWMVPLSPFRFVRIGLAGRWRGGAPGQCPLAATPRRDPPSSAARHRDLDGSDLPFKD